MTSKCFHAPGSDSSSVASCVPLDEDIFTNWFCHGLITISLIVVGACSDVLKILSLVIRLLLQQCPSRESSHGRTCESLFKIISSSDGDVAATVVRASGTTFSTVIAGECGTRCCPTSPDSEMF